MSITNVDEKSFDIALSKNKSIEEEKLKETIDKLLQTVIDNTKRIEDNCYKIDYKIQDQTMEDDPLNKYYNELNSKYTEYKTKINQTKTEDLQKINAANKQLENQLNDIKNNLKLETPHQINGKLNETVNYPETGSFLVGNK
jgi:predicted  nucleic acid-binding Zn-ribbon protein